MAKRTKIPDELFAQIQYASMNSCAVCHNANKGFQVHHLNEDPSDNSYDNLILLCLECHNVIHTSGGFIKRPSAISYKFSRDKWYERVVKIRDAQDSELVKQILAIGSQYNGYLDNRQGNEQQYANLIKSLAKIDRQSSQLLQHLAGKEKQMLEVDIATFLDNRQEPFVQYIGAKIAQYERVKSEREEYKLTNSSTVGLMDGIHMENNFLVNLITEIMNQYPKDHFKSTELTGSPKNQKYTHAFLNTILEWCVLSCQDGGTYSSLVIGNTHTNLLKALVVNLIYYNWPMESDEGLLDQAINPFKL